MACKCIFSPHLVMLLSKHGAARTDVNVRIQKARGSFFKQKRVAMPINTKGYKD
jgi:hypothetical protein